MHKWLIGGLALFALAGCEVDLRTNSSLEPTADPDIFRWRTFADAVYAEDSEKWEAARRRQLDKVVSLNGICPLGYSVIDRRATIKHQAMLGTLQDVFYTIRCR